MTGRRTAVGIIVTAVYLIIVGFLLLHAWPTAKTMALNNWGDFLGGVFAPLALFWLVLGYFQQGEELRQNTQALRLQADQLRHQVEETKALVQEAGAQARAAAEFANNQAAMLAHEERKGLPRFEQISVSRVEKEKTIWVEFHNFGGTMTSAQILNPRPGLPNARIEPSNVVATGKPARIVFDFDRTAPGQLEFDLVYTDANGTSRLSHFVIQGDLCYTTKHGDRADASAG